MKISFEINLKRLARLVIGMSMGLFVWQFLIEPYGSGVFIPMGIFGAFIFYMGSVFNGWFVERGLLYHFRTKGLTEEACKEGVEQMEGEFREMSMKDLFR